MKARDFELMHHFCTTTWSTMGMREDMRQVWRVVIPQEGYSHPFLMHGILALSALHKAYLLPDKRLRYLTLGAHHYTCGQGVYRKLMANVTDENWKPIFCFALILIAYVRSPPATRSEKYAIEDPILVILELFFMIRGLKAILAPYTLRFRKTNLSPLATAVWFVEETDVTDANLSLEFSPLPSNTFEVLADLRFFMRSQANLANREDIDEAISKLRIMTVQIAESGTNIEFATFMIWPYFLPDTFVLDIKEKRPHALVVLAYFVPFLAILERDYWFFKGMGRNLLNQIDACLEDHSALRVYLDWPKAHS
ncbi:hypothetical protein B0O99DRAFT_522052 [Bisporella sp. PMI_857]|nr:hypothetical protein B0O99DRAFT_522052 [Bisporella sp. PMI_857]